MRRRGRAREESDAAAGAVGVFGAFECAEVELRQVFVGVTLESKPRVVEYIRRELSALVEKMPGVQNGSCTTKWKLSRHLGRKRYGGFLLIVRNAD